MIHFFTLLRSIYLVMWDNCLCFLIIPNMIDDGNIWQLLRRNIIIFCVCFFIFGRKGYGESCWSRYFSNGVTRFIVQLWGKTANGVYNKVLFPTSDPATWSQNWLILPALWLSTSTSYHIIMLFTRSLCCHFILRVDVLVLMLQSPRKLRVHWVYPSSSDHHRYVGHTIPLWNSYKKEDFCFIWDYGCWLVDCPLK